MSSRADVPDGLPQPTTLRLGREITPLSCTSGSMTGMSSEDRVKGWQMPRQPRLSAEYARRANQWTQVCRVPPRPRELAFAAAGMRSSSRVARLIHQPSVCIQSQQTKLVSRRGRFTSGPDHPALRGTFRSSLTCTDTHFCPKCPVPARLQSHVTPVARGIPDGQEDGLAETFGLRQGLRSPRPPIHRIVLVLQQVRARRARKAVSHLVRHLSLASVVALSQGRTRCAACGLGWRGTCSGSAHDAATGDGGRR